MMADQRSSSNLIAPKCGAQQLQEAEEHQLRGNSMGNESCDISPDHDGSGHRRHLANEQRTGNFV